MNLFITGTDTGVGKTYVTTRLLLALRARGMDAVGFKPLCCGSRDDAEALLSASDHALSLNEVNPVWLRAPAAPYAAALVENRSIDLDLIRDVFTRLCERHATVLVEGVGGWLVPVLRDYTMGDLAAEWSLPVVVVVANRLGALNHAALTTSAIRAAGVRCLGMILNDGPPATASADENEVQAIARTTNSSVLADWLSVPVLTRIEHSQSDLSSMVSRWPIL